MSLNSFDLENSEKKTLAEVKRIFKRSLKLRSSREVKMKIPRTLKSYKLRKPQLTKYI